MASPGSLTRSRLSRNFSPIYAIDRLKIEVSTRDRTANRSSQRMAQSPVESQFDTLHFMQRRSKSHAFPQLVLAAVAFGCPLGCGHPPDSGDQASDAGLRTAQYESARVSRERAPGGGIPQSSVPYVPGPSNGSPHTQPYRGFSDSAAFEGGARK